MYLLKAALLDDNKKKLLLNTHMLQSIGMVAVVSSCTSAEAFLKEVKISQPEILFLDLNTPIGYRTEYVLN